ncbi:MAG: acetyl-CoA hydrolase/transferase family protein [Parvularculaceae bacterium]
MAADKSAIDAIHAMRERLAPAPRLYVPGCSGEPLLLADALKADPTLATDATFLGVYIPGINRTDYAGFHKTARSDLIFLAPDFRESLEARRAVFRPLTYNQAWRWLGETRIDAAFVQTSALDAEGLVSLGVSADFSPAVLARRDVVKIAHVNPLMPAPISGPRYPLALFDAVLRAERPILIYDPPPPPPIFAAIARHVASLIRDGDTLQFGLGNIQLAMPAELTRKKRLRIHSGMVSDPVLAALDAGVIADDPGAITTGVALGTGRLYTRAAQDGRFLFEPVGVTHDIRTLAALDNFVAINSAIEVDLFGQANAEFQDGKQVSGGGGLVDFLRGAAASKGGRPVIALASAARGGTVSRIVPRLDAPAVTVARADMGFVITEYGIADLRGADVEERARALIAVAHPDHRDNLARAWSKMSGAL